MKKFPNSDIAKIATEITERIRELAGKKPASFARKAGIRYQSFCKYLEGSEPGATKVVQIARASNVSCDWLLTGKEPEKKEADENLSTTNAELLAQMKFLRERLETVEAEFKEYKERHPMEGNEEGLGAVGR